MRIASLVVLLLLAGGCTSTRESAEPAGQAALYSSSWEQLTDVLRRTPGVRVSPDGSVRIRGSQEPPLIVVNETPLVANDLDFLNPADIRHIEVLSGAKASKYGFRAGRGVIRITTRRGL